MMVAARSKQAGQVLIVLFLGGLFLGGSAAGLSLLREGKPVYELQKEVKALVPQVDRRKRIDAVLDQWKDEAKAFRQHRSEAGKALFALMQRHDATRAEFDQWTAQDDAINADAREAMLKLRFALRDELSVAEWGSLFAPPPVSP